LIGYQNLGEFLNQSIEKYGDDEQKEALPQYIEYISDDNVNFVFNDDYLEIIFVNVLPRVIMALGFIQIPRTELHVHRNM
jgi:hypothetical protein